MTAADLIRDCKAYQAEHGIIALLEDIIEVQAQASGVVLLDEEDEDGLDGAEMAYFTVQ